MTEQLYLIEKRGLYYAPKAQGYTGIKAKAGRYTLEECALHGGPNGPDGPRDGITFTREEDAPDYSPACCSDIKERHMQEEIERLREVLKGMLWLALSVQDTHGLTQKQTDHIRKAEALFSVQREDQKSD